MKKVFRHLRESWILYILGIVVASLISMPIQKYVNSHYTEDISCTVTQASTDLRSGGSGGRRSSSFVSIVETKECGKLVFYSTFVKGAGMEDITNRLTEGQTYIFTVNRYVLFNNKPEIQGIRNTDGTPIDFEGN